MKAVKAGAAQFYNGSGSFLNLNRNDENDCGRFSERAAGPLVAAPAAEAAAPVAAANKPGWNCNAADDEDGAAAIDMCLRAIKSGAEMGRSDLKNEGNWDGDGDDSGERVEVKEAGVVGLGLAAEAAAAPKVEK